MASDPEKCRHAKTVQIKISSFHNTQGRIYGKQKSGTVHNGSL